MHKSDRIFVWARLYIDVHTHILHTSAYFVGICIYIYVDCGSNKRNLASYKTSVNVQPRLQHIHTIHIQRSENQSNESKKSF